eukprot:5016135-Prymnesium_polylepis.1
MRAGHERAYARVLQGGCTRLAKHTRCARAWLSHQLLAPQHLLHTNLLRRLAPLLAVEAEARARAADAEDAADEKDPNDSATDDDDLRSEVRGEGGV